MIDVSIWINAFLQALHQNFNQRVWFVGLQGSYGRGEASESSDIDLVVILDHLSASDIQRYDAMLDTLPNRELACGFLGGRDEIMNWEPSDLFQLYHDTSSVFGSLDELLPLLDSEAVKRAIKIGACNVFHGCVHNMLYEKSDEILIGLYKSACFTVQAISFMQTGVYTKRQSDLSKIVCPRERAIVDIYLRLKNEEAVELDKMSEILFDWSRAWIDWTDEACHTS